MAIKKQEFYEGAALYQLARGGEVTSIRYENPFFCVNQSFLLHLKYSTKGRSPWSFTFTPTEQSLMQETASKFHLVLGLVCGSDGIAGITYDAYREIAAPKGVAVHISCCRQHGQHYAITGPDGELSRKIAPSLWQRIITA